MVFDNQGRVRAIYHVSLGVVDTDAARRFYGAIFAQLGYRLLHEVVEGGRIVSLGWGLDWPELWTNLPASGGTPHPGSGVHVAFHAADRNAVDAFYRAGLANGGSDNGPPGYRPDYDPGYYGAFILDPDGNHLEAMWFDAEKSTG
jgi:catechol 2,3-dioxygenase-like lactoylglutathione lyase family enzyme